jgi:hypothetical protein
VGFAASIFSKLGLSTFERAHVSEPQFCEASLCTRTESTECSRADLFQRDIQTLLPPAARRCSALPLRKLIIMAALSEASSSYAPDNERDPSQIMKPRTACVRARLRRAHSAMREPRGFAAGHGNVCPAAATPLVCQRERWLPGESPAVTDAAGASASRCKRGAPDHRASTAPAFTWRCEPWLVFVQEAILAARWFVGLYARCGSWRFAGKIEPRTQLRLAAAVSRAASREGRAPGQARPVASYEL